MRTLQADEFGLSELLELATDIVPDSSPAVATSSMTDMMNAVMPVFGMFMMMAMVGVMAKMVIASARQ